MSEGEKGLLLVALLSELVPVCETAGHKANEDVVEWLGPSPLLLRIVNLEGAVWRDAGIVSSAQLRNGGVYKAG